MNRNSSVPKSVLRYVLVKGRYFDPETLKGFSGKTNLLGKLKIYKIM